MTQPKFSLSAFRKATRSNEPPNKCVHIARGNGWVIVRDTKQEFGSDSDHQFGFLVDQFDVFQDAIRAAGLRTALIPVGTFEGCCMTIEHRAADENVFRSTIHQDGLAADAELVFTDAEIVAFFDGVHNREFDIDGKYTAHTADCAADCNAPNHVAYATAV